MSIMAACSAYLVVIAPELAAAQQLLHTVAQRHGLHIETSSNASLAVQADAVLLGSPELCTSLRQKMRAQHWVQSRVEPRCVAWLCAAPSGGNGVYMLPTDAGAGGRDFSQRELVVCVAMIFEHSLQHPAIARELEAMAEEGAP